MKKFIQQKNQYLLENHPTLWNTKILWMLAASSIIHLLFFIAGLLSLMDPEALQKYRVIENYFSNGVVLLGILISVLMLVVWMISMFRNNAFKNFYPFTRLKLFKHFVAYFIIFIASTTFYYSFTLGMQLYTSTAYDDDRMAKEISIINKGMPLLPFELMSYELDRLRQPAPFDTLYCQTSSKNLDREAPYYEFKDQFYQYYILKEITFNESEVIRSNSDVPNKYVFNETINGKRFYYLKDRVVKPELPFNNAAPSFYNFSDVFYLPENSSNYYSESLYYRTMESPSFNKLTPARKQQTLINQQLLKEGEKSVEEALSQVLKIAADYQIKNNIVLSEWMNSQSYQQPYSISELINNGTRPYVRPYNNNGDSDFERYEKELRKNNYFDANSLSRCLENIHEIKTTNIFEGSLHVFMWLGFLFSVIVFMFRVTGLKPLLFSVVSVGLLAVFTSLLAVFIGYLLSFPRDGDILIYILIISISTVILIAALGYAHRMKKLIAGIFMNITMMGIVPYMVLIIAFISSIQEKNCPYGDGHENRDSCLILWDVLGVYWSYLFWALGMLFIYWFCKRLMTWRAMPEG